MILELLNKESCYIISVNKWGLRESREFGFAAEFMAKEWDRIIKHGWNPLIKGKTKFLRISLNLPLDTLKELELVAWL